MQNASLDESEAGIKISNNLTYVDDTAPNGRKQRGTKETPDEGKRRE